MKKITTFTLTLMLLSFMSCNPIEYDIFGSIEGIVQDYDTNAPLEDVYVQLSPGSRNCMTSSDGKFTFPELDAKQYTVTVQKNYYETNIMTVDVMSSETSQIIIRMKKKDY